MPKIQFDGSLAPKAATTLTIDTGVVTVTQLKHIIASEAGVEDDLATVTVSTDIESGYEGILLLTADSGDTITLKHSTGNIELSGAVDVDVAAGQWLILIYDGTNWRDLTTTPSGGGVDARYFAVAGDEVEGDMTFADTVNIITDTGTGTEIGTAADQKIGFHGATPIVQAVEITDELTDLTHTAPDPADFAIQDLIDSGAGNAFGFATKNEGNTVLQVIVRNAVRVKAIEDLLVAKGLLADAD